jgi:hypothetical protein
MDGLIRDTPKATGKLSGASVRGMLLQESIKKTLERKRVSKSTQDRIGHSARTNSFSRSNAINSPRHGGTDQGNPTRQRYHYVTVFVDQFSGLSFVHLQKTSSGEETLDTKMAFEGFARSLNVQIQH